MDKYEGLKKLNGSLDGIRNTIDGIDLDLSKKEDLDILIALRKELDDVILNAVSYQSFQEGYGLGVDTADTGRSTSDVEKQKNPAVYRPHCAPDEKLDDVPNHLPTNRTEGDPNIDPHMRSPLPARTEGQEDKKEVFSENSIGKYLIGVLASLLILAGVAVLAATIWNYITDPVKFTMVLLMGLLMSGLGFLLGCRGKNANAFHLSLMGCGTAIIYCDLIAAKLAWALFPDPVILLLFIIWMVSGFVLSKKLHSDIMFTIIQIGNAVSILLTIRLMEIGPSLWLILLFVICTVVLTTVYANQGFHKANSLASSYITIIAYLMICSRLGQLLLGYQAEGDYSVIVSCSLLYLGLFVFSACLFWLIPYGIRGFSENTAKWLVASQLLLLAVEVVFIKDRIGQLNVLSGMISKPAPELLYFLILMAALIKKNTRSFNFMVLSVNITFLLIDLSSFFFDNFGLLPALMCLVIVLSGLRFKDLWLKIGAVVVYSLITCCMLMYSLINLFTSAFNSDISLCVLHGLLILIPCAVIADIVKNGERAEKRRFLALICLDSAVFYGFLMFFNLDFWMMWGTVFAAAAFSIFSRLPVFKEDKLCRIHNLAGHGLVQVCLWAALSGYVSTWEMAAGCLILLLFTAKIVYESLEHMKRTGSHILPLVCCVLMTVNAVDVLHKTPLGDYGILTSLTCLLAAGFCIVLGFKCRVKPLRTYGLILVIFSVLKMVTLDIASTDSIIRVAAFIGGGLLCFGISWAYNRADKEDERKDN